MNELTIQEANARIRERQEKELMRMFQYADVENLSLFHEEPGVIEEEFFVQVFLPYFAGMLAPEDFPKGITPYTWYQIAGSPSNRVNVVKNGEVLFTVPPIVDTGGVVNPTIHKTPYHRSASAIEELKRVNPLYSDNIMRVELGKRLPVNYQDVREQNLRTWAEIFLRYGYFLPEEKEEESSPAQTLNDVIDDEWE